MPVTCHLLVTSCFLFSFFFVSPNCILWFMQKKKAQKMQTVNNQKKAVGNLLPYLIMGLECNALTVITFFEIHLWDIYVKASLWWLWCSLADLCHFCFMS